MKVYFELIDISGNINSIIFTLIVVTAYTKSAFVVDPI